MLILYEGKNLFSGHFEGIWVLKLNMHLFTWMIGEMTASFVNNIRTKMGELMKRIKSAITRAFHDYARKYNLLKEKEKNLDGVDIPEV